MSSRHHQIQPVIRDAATLILLKLDGGAPRVLMGRRAAGHVFMPGVFVFPGGRRERADCFTPPGKDLHPVVLDKLQKRMRGKASRGRARGLAMAAVRETCEETGFLAACPRPAHRRAGNGVWQLFHERGLAPDLSHLRYFARAITPAGMARRFDARFFIMDARHLANVRAPAAVGPPELLGVTWLSIDETRNRPLPRITRRILDLLQEALKRDGPALFAPDRPVSFHYKRGKSWRLEWL